MEISKAGKLTFQMPYNHPKKSMVHKKKTRFYVARGNTPIWSGRVLDTKKTFYKAIEVTVEGALTYFLDTIQRPYTYLIVKEWYEHEIGTVVTQISPSIVLKYLISKHNNDCDSDKRFTVDIVSVDPSEEEVLNESQLKKSFKVEEYLTTKDEINNTILEKYGGFILAKYNKLEHKNKLIYCLTESGMEQAHPQKIEFGKNMLDFSEEISSENIYTKCIPLGATYNDFEILRKKAYDREKRASNVDMPNWEDSGFSMPDDVDKNTKITLNKKINLWYKEPWDVDDILSDDFVIYDNDDVSEFGSITTSVDIKIPLPSNLPSTKSDCNSLYSDYRDELKNRGKKWLKKNRLLSTSITVNAVDLAYITSGIDHIDCGCSIPVVSKPHGLNDEGINLLCSACTINLISPGESQYTIGAVFKALTDKSVANKEQSGKAYSIASNSYSM